MRAMLCRRLADGIDHLELADIAPPTLGPGEVRVRLQAAAINFPDLLMLRGRYQFRPPLPFSPGVEGAGQVIEAGPGADRFAAGDAVMVRARYGTFAEEIAVPESACRPLPAGVDPIEAAAASVAPLTAYVALVRRGALQAGETLLVHGAAGGVGLATVGLGRILGATVIAVASSPAKRDAALAAGAHHILAPDEDLAAAVKALTGGQGADVIFDPVGGDSFDSSTRCIAFGGRILVAGFAGGRIATVATNIPLLKGFSIVGVRAGEYGRRFPNRGRENLGAIDALLAAGTLRPRICATFPLDQAVAAMHMLADRTAIGRVVLTM